MSIQMIPLAAIRPNKYRRIETYKLSESKIEALIQSYAASGFWDGSIQARPHPTEAGAFEIAFGHHRVKAAERAGLVVADRSDADILRMMADENDEEFRSDALVRVETIAAVIEAYGRGEIELESVPPDVRRDARYVLPGGNTYTLRTVARFIGWVKASDGHATSACRLALDAYQMRATTHAALAAIPAAQRSEAAIETVLIAAHSARYAATKAGFSRALTHEAEKAAAGAAADEVRERSGFKARSRARMIGHAGVSRVKGKKKRSPPPVEKYIAKLTQKCQTLEPYQKILEECRHLTPFISDLDKTQTRNLAAALEGMLTRSAIGVKSVATALRSHELQKLRKLPEP